MITENLSNDDKVIIEREGKEWMSWMKGRNYKNQKINEELVILMIN